MSETQVQKPTFNSFNIRDKTSLCYLGRLSNLGVVIITLNEYNYFLNEDYPLIIIIIANQSIIYQYLF